VKRTQLKNLPTLREALDAKELQELEEVLKRSGAPYPYKGDPVDLLPVGWKVGGRWVEGAWRIIPGDVSG